jgi:hypothetical protein
MSIFMNTAMPPLFHVTDPANIPSIQKEGIRPKRRRIYLITDRSIANTIARDQIFLKRFALFEIDAAGTPILHPDQVAEFSAKFHRVVHGSKCILPRFLSLIGIFDTDVGFTEADRMRYKQMGAPPEVIEKIEKMFVEAVEKAELLK